MNVLVVGNGGREHALAWKLSQSDRVKRLFCAPGNGGTASIAENVPVLANDIPGLLELAREKRVDLTIVGPEGPLCAGIVDRFTEAGLRILGPTRAAARIEGDKGYAKRLMKDAAIPTADGRVFDDYEQAREFVATRDTALVVKAAGLAAGKGVMVCAEPAEALLALEHIMVERAFGDAGNSVVVEDKLNGEEISIHVLVDGRTIHVLEPSQDHKRLGDGDTGPNTGGMGAYSPAVLLDDSAMTRVYGEILVPLVDTLNRRNTPYRGVLYVGLMLTPAGPKVLEFNCRFGDPEAQVLLPRLKTDFVDLAEAVIDAKLDQLELDWDPRPAVCVVMSAKGYPAHTAPGKVILGLDQVADFDEVFVFHSGTIKTPERIRTNGGRVLGVTALGADVKQACERAYRAVDTIKFDGAHYRRDIAHHALRRDKTTSESCVTFGPGDSPTA